MSHTARQWNRTLTKAVVQRLGRFRRHDEMTPLETLAACIPGLNVAVDLADLPSKLADFYQSLVVANARALRRQRKLSVTARQALERYEQALMEEQRAYGALVKVFDKDPPY